MVSQEGIEPGSAKRRTSEDYSAWSRSGDLQGLGHRIDVDQDLSGLRDLQLFYGFALRRSHRLRTCMRFMFSEAAVSKRLRQVPGCNGTDLSE